MDPKPDVEGRKMSTSGDLLKHILYSNRRQEELLKCIDSSLKMIRYVIAIVLLLILIGGVALAVTAEQASSYPY